MTMRLRLVPRAALLARVSPHIYIPATVDGGDGISVTYSGSVYTVGLDFGALAESGSIAAADRDNLLVAAWNEDTETYSLIALDTLIGVGSTSQAWDADLDAIAALASTGILVRTASNTWAQRTLTGTAAEITVANGNGVAGNPTISLPAAMTFTGKTVTGGTFNGLAGATITPTAGTTNAGIAITQSGSSASTAGPISYNTVTLTSSGPITGSGGIPLNNQGRAFYTQHNLTGSTLTGGFYGGMFFLNDSSTSATPIDRSAMVGISYSTGTNPGSFSALNASAILAAGSTSVEIVGGEFEALTSATATVTNRIGVKIHASSLPTGGSWAGIGSNHDTAVAIVSHGTAAPFSKMISLVTSDQENPTDFPIAATGDLFYADAAGTIANVFNLPNLTVTAKIFNFPNFTVDGPLSQNASNLVLIRNNSTGVSANAAFLAQNSVSGVSFGVGGSGFTDVPILQNRGYVRSVQSGSSGLVLDVGGATNPLIFATDDIERGRVTPTGGLAWGLTTDTTAGVINVLTGFRINSAAASGHFLRGNGGTYVDGQVAVGDLTGLGTNVATALAVNVGTAGAFVVNGGAGAFTTLSATGQITSTVSTGTAPLVIASTTVVANLHAVNTDQVGGVDQTTAWTAYTPTLSATAGTLTTTSATGRSKTIGKTVHFQADVTLTNVGTATGGLNISLPSTAAAFNYVCAGKEIAVNGKQCSGVILPSTANCRVYFYDFTTVLVNGYNIVVSGTYEAA